MTDHAQRAIALIAAYLSERGYEPNTIAMALEEAGRRRAQAGDKNAQYACNGFQAGVRVAGGNGRTAWEALVRKLDQITDAPEAQS